jgi:hypothetical protein
MLASVARRGTEPSYLSSAMLELLSGLERVNGVNLSLLLTTLFGQPGTVATVLAEAGVKFGMQLSVIEAEEAPTAPQVLHLLRYVYDAKKLIAAAQRVADDRKHTTVEPIHLLCALREVDPHEVAEILEVLEIDLERALERVPKSTGDSSYLAPPMLTLLGNAERFAEDRQVTVADVVRALRDAMAAQPPQAEPEVIATMTPPDSGGKHRAWSGIDALVALLTRKPEARLLGRDGKTATVAIDSGEGRNLGVLLAPGRIVMSAVREDEYEELGILIEDDEVNAAIYDLAYEIATALQRATGWYVDSEHFECEPIGSCPKCDVEAFDWEETCAACGSDLDADDEEEVAEASAGSDEDEEEEEEGPFPRRLGALAPPDGATASPWHRARAVPPIAELVALLLLFPGARIEHQNDSSAVVVVEVGDGESPLRMSMRRDSLVVDELCAKSDDEGSSDAVDERAYAILTSIQQATRWYAHAPTYDGLEPCGGCPKCRLEVFRWQTACRACATPIPDGWLSKEEHLAELLVERLLEKELIELASERADVELALTWLIRAREPKAGLFLDAIAELDEVEEIYCDELSFEPILEWATKAADAAMRGR